MIRAFIISIVIITSASIGSYSFLGYPRTGSEYAVMESTRRKNIGFHNNDGFREFIFKEEKRKEYNRKTGIYSIREMHRRDQ